VDDFFFKLLLLLYSFFWKSQEKFEKMSYGYLT